MHPSNSNWFPNLRFSIRELFLLTTTIASLLALALTSFRSRDQLELSQFFDAFDVEQLVLRAGHGVECEPTLTGRAYDSWSYGAEWNFCKYNSLVLKVPNIRVDSFLDQLQSIVEGKLQAAGCEIESGQSGFGGAAPRTRTFSFDYRTGQNVGCVHVWACEVGPELVHVLTYMREGKRI